MEKMIKMIKRIGLSSDDLLIEAETLEECGEYLHGVLMGYPANEIRKAAEILRAEK